MGLVVMDVFNVKVIDSQTGKLLFEIDSAVETNLSIDGQEETGTLKVKDCFLNVDIFDEVMGGRYEEKKLVLHLLGRTRDSETGRYGKLDIIAYSVELDSMSMNSNQNRLMTNNINFFIYKRDENGNRNIVIRSEMDEEYGE